MSLWEFSAACGGYAKANGASSDRLPEEDLDRLSATLRSLRPDLA